MRILINADDFGFTAGITEAIHRSMCSGWLQQTSLMMNTSASEDAVRLAKENGYQDRCCFHLNLEDGYPLTEQVRHTALCDPATGKFRKATNGDIQRHCASAAAVQAIRCECEAQMRAFRENGFASRRIDSHRWCLCNVPVWTAVKPLLEKYGFETTRTMNGHLTDSSAGAKKLYYKAVSVMIGGRLERPEVWSGCGSEFLAAASGAGWQEEETVEWYVHPKMIDGVPVDYLFSYDRVPKPVEEVAALAGRYAQQGS